jgi:hypothetical protein
MIFKQSERRFGLIEGEVELDCRCVEALCDEGVRASAL